MHYFFLSVIPSVDPCGPNKPLVINGTLHPSGNISSPNYPSNYPDSSSCRWLIQAEEGKVITLTIVDFHTESRYFFPIQIFFFVKGYLVESLTKKIAQNLFYCSDMTSFTSMMDQTDGINIMACIHLEMGASITFLAQSEHHPINSTSSSYLTIWSITEDGWSNTLLVKENLLTFYSRSLRHSNFQISKIT